MFSQEGMYFQIVCLVKVACIFSVQRACIFCEEGRACIFSQESMYFLSRGHVFSVKRAWHVFLFKRACIFIQEGMYLESLCVVNLAADFVAHKTSECQ